MQPNLALQSAEYRANIVDDIVLGDHDGLIARIEHHVVGRHFSLAVFAAVNGDEQAAFGQVDNVDGHTVVHLEVAKLLWNRDLEQRDVSALKRRHNTHAAHQGFFFNHVRDKHG